MRIFRYIILGTVLLLMVIADSFVRAQTITISPKNSAEIIADKSMASIGDLYTLLSSNSALIAQIRRIPVIELNNPGGQQQVQEYQVQSKLRQAGYGDQVEILGEYPLIVKTESRLLSTRELQGIIDDHFQRIMTQAEVRGIRWNFIRQPEIHVFPGDPYSIEFSNRNKVRPGRCALQGILTNGAYQKSITLLLDVKITQAVFITKSDIQRGELLTLQNVRKEIRALDVRESQYAVEHLPSGGNTVARRDIRKGTVLLSTMVKKQDIVHSGKTVRLLVYYGSIKVQSYGKAIESGALAEQIRVRDQESGKILKGTILDHQTIQIEPLQNL